MVLQYVKKTEKYGGVRIYNPDQKVVAVTHEFRGYPFVFFNNGRGCIVGKGIKPTYDQYGNVISDFTFEDVVEHFKGLGFLVEEDKIKKETKEDKPKEKELITASKITKK